MAFTVLGESHLHQSPNKIAPTNAGWPPRLHSHAIGPAWLRFPLGKTMKPFFHIYAGHTGVVIYDTKTHEYPGGPAQFMADLSKVAESESSITTTLQPLSRTRVKLDNIGTRWPDIIAGWGQEAAFIIKRTAFARLIECGVTGISVVEVDIGGQSRKIPRKDYVQLLFDSQVELEWNVVTKTYVVRSDSWSGKSICGVSTYTVHASFVCTKEVKLFLDQLDLGDIQVDPILSR